MSIERTRAIQTPQKAYEWELNINGPSTGGLEGLKAYAQTVSIPEESTDTIEIPHKSEKTTHAGRVASARTFTVNFFDDEAGTVYRYFKAWMNLIKNNRTGGGVDRSLYSANVEVQKLLADSETAGMLHLFEGAFPTNLGEISLSYESSEVVKFDVTFTFQVHDVV